jgi:hypothetical protein
LTFDPALIGSSYHQLPVREHLRAWQQENSRLDPVILDAFENHPAHGEEHIQNHLSKLSFEAKADEADIDNGFRIREDDEDEELVTIGLFLNPGDVVELSQPGHESVLAVFVQQLGLKSQFFSANGRWCHSNLQRITFAVPGCIDPDLINPLIPFMPTKPTEVAANDTTQVPRHLAAPVQAVLHQLIEHSERIYRTNAPVLDSAYSILADANRPRLLTLSQIAKTLLAKTDPTWTPSPPSLLAVRKALNHNEFRFRSDARSHRLTNVFSIRSKNDVEVVETVQEWIREYKEHEAQLANLNRADDQPRRRKGAAYIADFITKARRLISVSRKYRQPLPGCVGPSQNLIPLSETDSNMRVEWGEEFNRVEKQIINFFQSWVLTGAFQNMANLHSSCTVLLNYIGLYQEDHLHHKGIGRKDTMGRNIGYLFLQELGVLSPHENRNLYDEQLMLPTVRLSRNLELLTTKAELIRRNPDFRDSMSDLRRDWGDTLVWCIDDAEAHEIDDGVSIERVPGRKSEFWVHAHIANPTAFFDKTHVLSGLAAHMTETVYTPERVFPMIPTWASKDYFGLKPNRPVITFSSRIDGAGNTLETKIQHGIIRNVKSITYTDLSTYLGETFKGNINRLVVGGEVPLKSERTLPEFQPSRLQNLQDMYTAAKAVWASREAAGAVRYNMSSSDVRVLKKSGQSGLTWRSPSMDKARLIHGDPVIQVSASAPGGVSGMDSRNIVEEMMLLACRSAASWCAERGIPVMFRGTVEMPTLGMSSEEIQRKLVNPQLEKQGYLSPAVVAQYVGSLGRSVAHSAPIPHRGIGAKAYLKVTSPLRRFSDMIAHWQIEAAVRHEARTGQKINSALLANAQRPILPFSQRQMQESIITLSPRERIIAQAKRGSVHHWALQAFMRALYFKEAPLPETFTCWIRTVDMDKYNVGVLTDLSMKVIVENVPGMTFQIGDEFEVKLARVDLFYDSLFVTPIRLLRREKLFQQ